MIKLAEYSISALEGDSTLAGYKALARRAYHNEGAKGAGYRGYIVINGNKRGGLTAYFRTTLPSTGMNGSIFSTGDLT